MNKVIAAIIAAVVVVGGGVYWKTSNDSKAALAEKTAMEEKMKAEEADAAKKAEEEAAAAKKAEEEAAAAAKKADEEAAAKKAADEAAAAKAAEAEAAVKAAADAAAKAAEEAAAKLKGDVDAALAKLSASNVDETLKAQLTKALGIAATSPSLAGDVLSRVEAAITEAGAAPAAPEAPATPAALPDPNVVLAVETFDLAGASALIDASSMTPVDKTLLKTALERAADKPGLLPLVLDRVKAAILAQ
jgi:hypothetical protein